MPGGQEDRTKKPDQTSDRCDFTQECQDPDRDPEQHHPIA